MTMKWNKYIWLLADACAALTDQVLDMVMLYEYAANDDWDFFCIGLGAIFLPSLLLGLFGIVYGSSFDAHERMVLCLNFFPGINVFTNAARLLRAFLGERFEDRGEDWVERWYNKYEEEYVFVRLVEAMLEAGPQTILQAFVALRRPEGINANVLYASMIFSIFSVSKTLVSSIVFWRKSGTHLSDPEKARMFVLSLSYEMCEVVSRVFSVALLGYFCGGWFVAAFLAGEYALLSIILAARGMYSTCGQNGIGACVLSCLSLPLFIMVTSLMCSDRFPLLMLLLFRLLVLGAYGIVSIVLKDNDADLTGNTKVFFWAAVVACAFWALLMPAFADSCANLGISLNYTDYEPKECCCHFGVGRDNHKHDCCMPSCIFHKKAAELASGEVDIVEIAVVDT